MIKRKSRPFHIKDIIDVPNFSLVKLVAINFLFVYTILYDKVYKNKKLTASFRRKPESSVFLGILHIGIKVVYIFNMTCAISR